jgi:hypothetical protein
MFLRECKGGCLAWFAILVMVLINKNKKEVSMRNPFIAVFFLIWLSACAGPFYEEPVISDKMNSKIRSGVKAVPLMMDSFLLLSSLRRKKAFSTSPS